MLAELKDELPPVQPFMVWRERRSALRGVDTTNQKPEPSEAIYHDEEAETLIKRHSATQPTLTVPKEAALRSQQVAMASVVGVRM
jgi:hypothetical protein